MFGSGVLDTAIGLVFVFLLISMLVTIGNELIAAVLLSRAKWLRIGVDRLLGSDWAHKLYAHPLIDSSSTGAVEEQADGGWQWRGSGPSYIPSRSFANVLVGLIRDGDAVLVEARAALHDTLDAASAADATVAALQAQLAAAGANNPVLRAAAAQLRANGSVADARVALQHFAEEMPVRYLRDALHRIESARIRKTLLTLLDDAQGDVEKFKQNVEIWFDHAMDRVGGWYKRRSQWVVAGLGVLAAVGMNVDALLIVRHLETHPGERDALVAQAKAYADNPPPRLRAAAAVGGNADVAAAASSPQASTAAAVAPAASAPLIDPALRAEFADVQSQLTQLGLPIGWVRAAGNATERDTRQVVPHDQASAWDALRYHALGWFITALAATLGAPFWFDMLNRVISIRSAGKAPEERPKPPKDVPLPLEPGQTPQEADMAEAGKRPR